MADLDIPQSLLEIFKAKRPIPLKLDLCPTNRCNLNCRHCRRQTEQRIYHGNELSAERYKDIIREGGRLGVRKVEFVGSGEPTYHQETAMTCFREIKRAGMFGDLVTNGTRFTDEMVREMVELKWDRIMFSIDAADAHTHDYIRGKKGAFKKALAAMRRFTYWKQELGVDRPLMGMVPVLTNLNHTHFSDFIRLAHDVGAYHVGFKPMMIYTPEAESWKLAESNLLDMNRHIAEAIPLAERYGIETNFREVVHRPENEIVKRSGDIVALYREDVSKACDDIVNRFCLDEKHSLVAEDSGNIYENFLRFVQIPCFLPWYNLKISSEGDVLPCIGSGPLEGMPNLRDCSLKEAFYGDVFTRFRDSLAVGKFPDQCAGCCAGLIFDNRKFRAELLKGVLES